MILEPSAKQKKLEDKLNAYYFSLANIDALSDKEQEKLYKEIRNTIAQLDDGHEKAEAWTKFLSESSDELKARMKDTINSNKKGFFISRAPANGTIDYREEKAHHFARGMNFYKQFIILFVGSFAGVVVELLWCFVRHGYLYSFIGGFMTGSVVEYACSYFQEMFFGSTSWDYSNIPLNLNGRICLLYSIFWGFLGVFWIKSVYPRFSIWVLKIPNRIGKILVWILLFFLLFDAAISSIAVFRWSERRDGKAASNAIERIVDERFPDSRMQRIYPNMDFIE